MFLWLWPGGRYVSCLVVLSEGPKILDQRIQFNLFSDKTEHTQKLQNCSVRGPLG